MLVKSEQIHEVPHDQSSIRLKWTGRRLRERTHESALNPRLARHQFALGDNEPPPDAAVFEGLTYGAEILRQSCVVGLKPVGTMTGLTEMAGTRPPQK